MHPTAMTHANLFFQTYSTKIPFSVVVDIGAQDVNGSLREVCPSHCKYIGVDFVAAKGVDVVLQDPYKLPFDDSSVDIVVSSSCFEHSEMFWVLFLDILRVLKPSGLFYLNVPSNGSIHRYPVDCWRFYPDSGNALVTWAKRNNYPSILLESFTGRQGNTGDAGMDRWNDYVAVFLKDASSISNFPDRILHQYRHFDNGYLHGSDNFLNGQQLPEDILKNIILLRQRDCNELYITAQNLTNKGDHNEAIITLSKLLEICPDYAIAHNDLGVLYFNRGDRERALNHYEKAAQFNPENITFQKNLADFYFVVMERIDDALKIYLKILDKHPGDIETLLALGQACSSLNRIEDARFFFGKVLEIEPGNINARQYLDALRSKLVDPASESLLTSEYEQSLDASQSKLVGPTKRVSIIIPVYNKVEFTKKCLAALVKNTSREMYELIIVDNASTDGTKDFFEGLRGDLKVIVNEKNLGFAKACNQGARAAAGQYLLFLNNDTEPLYGWLEPLIAVADSDASVGAVGSKLLFPDKTIQHSGVIIIDNKKTHETLTAIHNFYRKPEKYPAANIAHTYQALTAACLLIRRTAFEQAGGFDEGYWNGYEDVDLCFNLRTLGWVLVYEPASVLIHHESQSGPERFTKVHRNIARLLDKWVGRIKPDVIYEADGAVKPVNDGNIGPYVRPGATVRQPAQRRNIGTGVVSIVILTFNQVKYTKECVESIRKHTPEPHEIIFVDNGSTDGTVKWLRQIVKDNPEYKLIENKKNLGFSKGCNQGIEAAAGEYLLLLNNDVVVTEHWLSGMLECLNSAPDTGIVGPMTNNISGPQKVPTVDYSSIDGLGAYARAFRKQNRHRRIPLRRIVGFCMLFRCRLVEDVGLLDESFGSGNFEDDDYCLRAALLGFRNVVAGDVFIHHYGSRSFIGNKINYSTSLSGNRKIFTDKWSGIEVTSPLGKKLVVVNAINSAHELYHKGAADTALSTLLESIKQAPEDREALYFLAETLIDAKRFKDALDVLGQLPAGELDAKKPILTGYAEEGLGHDETAGAHADQALFLSPSSAQALNLKGVLAYKKGDCATAEAFFKKAVESDPGYGEPYTNLGVVKWAAEDRVNGLDMLERGFRLTATAADIIALYHSAITAMGEYARAEQVFREALALHPLNKRIAFLLIDVLIQQEKHDLAMREIERAMIHFGIDDGILAAALDIRSKVGPRQINENAKNSNALSLCMIVKNEEQHLHTCLMSVRAAVDEMIVVDTGSSDRTKDIARAFGAKVFDFPWTGDFSEARNFSLAKASGDWILILDADEAISPQDHPELSRLIAKQGKPIAYAFVTRNYILPVYRTGWTKNDDTYREQAGSGWFGSVKVRLFPRDSRIQFTNPVHELVEPSLEKTGVRVKDCSIPIHHYGKMDQEKSNAKGEEYYLLGRKKLSEKGEDEGAIRELAIQAGELKRFTEAIELWQRAVKLRPDMDIAYINMASLYFQMDRFNEALAAGKKAMELVPDSKEAVCNYALGEMYAGDAGQAITALKGLLKKDPAYPSANIMLAIAYFCAGRKNEGTAAFTSLRISGPAFAESIYPFARKLVTAGRIEYTTALLDAAVENNAKSDSLSALRAECVGQPAPAISLANL